MIAGKLYPYDIAKHANQTVRYVIPKAQKHLDIDTRDWLKMLSPSSGAVMVTKYVRMASENVKGQRKGYGTDTQPSRARIEPMIELRQTVVEWECLETSSNQCCEGSTVDPTHSIAPKGRGSWSLFHGPCRPSPVQFPC